VHGAHYRVQIVPRAGIDPASTASTARTATCPDGRCGHHACDSGRRPNQRQQPVIGKKFYFNPANHAEYDASNATATCSTKAALQEMRKTPSVRRRRRRRSSRVVQYHAACLRWLVAAPRH
jgi:hypothetical protein